MSGDGGAWERNTMYAEKGTITKKQMTVKVSVMILERLLFAL